LDQILYLVQPLDTAEGVVVLDLKEREGHELS
jgi:hypothetical protein